MTRSWASMRTWLIAAFTAAAVLVAATTAAAVIGLDHHDDRAGGSRDDDRGTSWMWMHGQVDDEADYLSRMVAHHREAVAAAGQLPLRPAPDAGLRRRHRQDPVRPDRADERVARPVVSRDPLTGLPADDARPDRPVRRRPRPRVPADMTVHHMAAVMMSQQLLAVGWRPTPRWRTWRAPSATSSTPRSSGCSDGCPPGTARSGMAAAPGRWAPDLAR